MSSRKKLSLGTRIKQLLLDNLLTSSCHGLPKLFSAETILLKIVWGFFFLLGTVLCSYFVVQNIITYMSHEVVTNIEIETGTPIKFPTVMICSPNTLYALNLTEENWNGVKEIFDSAQNSSRSLSEETDNIDKIRRDYFHKSDSKDKRVLFDESIIRCQFDFKPCDFEDFYVFKSPIQYCFIYNMMPPHRNSSKAGEYDGLTIEMYLGESEIDNRKIPTKQIKSGISINLYEKVVNLNNPIYVSPGKSANIGINKVIERKLPAPFSDCMDNETIEKIETISVKNTVKLIGEYKKDFCLDICVHEQVINECECYLEEYFAIKPKDYPPCANNPCFNEVWIKGHQNIQTCEEKCPLECEMTYYEHSTSSSDYPKRSYAELLYNRTFLNKKYEMFDYDKMKGDLVSFNIYYNVLKATKILQVEKFGILDFVAAGGGFLGLFLGVSLLTLVEILEIGIKLFSLFCRNSVFELKEK